MTDSHEDGCRRRKDLGGLRARTKLPVHGRRHYQVFLWESREAMVSGGLKRGMRGAKACVCHEPLRINIAGDGAETVASRRSKLGEVHFHVDGWNEEIVAHEALHAAIGASRWIGPKLADLDSGSEIEQEEALCYRLGEMFSHLYRWLWKHNPNPRWQRRTVEGSGSAH